MATSENDWSAWAASHQGALKIWTSGVSLAASSRSGPSGVGVVYDDDRDDVHAEQSEVLGESTTHAAELAAVLRGLEQVPDRQRAERVVVFVWVSQYVVGMLARGWRARANVDLVTQVRERIQEFGDLRVVWIASSEVSVSAERARQLAREAARGNVVDAARLGEAPSAELSVEPPRGTPPGGAPEPAPASAETRVAQTPEPGVGQQLALWPDPDPVQQVLAAREEWSPEREEAERTGGVCSEDRVTADYVDGWNDALGVHALPLAHRLQRLLRVARRLQEGLVEATGYLAQVERGIRSMGYRIPSNERLEPLRQLAHACSRLEVGEEQGEQDVAPREAAS